MPFPKYKDLNTLNTLKDIDEQVEMIQKELFNLRMKLTGMNLPSPHQFVHLKRQIRQLKTKRQSVVKFSKY